MICSCLIPSRSRPAQLKRVIETIRGTSRPENVEILVRLDDDDPMRGDYRIRDATVIVGKRKLGYGSVPDFYAELAEHAKAPWVALFNDDTDIYGRGWDEQLQSVPPWGFFVQPEIHKLNDNIYERDQRGPVPFVPNGCWKALTKEQCMNDVGLHTLLVTKNRWKVYYLKGITIFHDRHIAHSAEEERQRVGEV